MYFHKLSNVDLGTASGEVSPNPLVYDLDAIRLDFSRTR